MEERMINPPAYLCLGCEGCVWILLTQEDVGDEIVQVKDLESLMRVAPTPRGDEIA